MKKVPQIKLFRLVCGFSVVFIIWSVSCRLFRFVDIANSQTLTNAQQNSMKIETFSQKFNQSLKFHHDDDIDCLNLHQNHHFGLIFVHDLSLQIYFL
jgi:hypothetical protein